MSFLNQLKEDLKLISWKCKVRLIFVGYSCKWQKRGVNKCLEICANMGRGGGWTPIGKNHLNFHFWLVAHLRYGTCQKRFSGIRPLRGGWGYPPFPLRKKTFFFSHWFSVKGGVGVPPNSAKEKNLLFRSKNSIFCLFLCIFSPFWTIIWPFWPIFNLI